MKKKDWLYLILITLVLSLGFRLIPLQFIQSLAKDPAQADAWTAFGTILLAIATIILALFTWLSTHSADEREKLRREDELAREQRDRKEKLLNEVIGWAEDVLKIGYSSNIDYTKLGVIHDKIQEFAFIYDALSKITHGYESIKQKSVYIEKVAEVLSNELLVEVMQLKKCICDYVEELDYVLGTSDRGKETREKLKYNSLDANNEIKGRLSNTKDKIFTKSDEIEVFAKKIIELAIISRSKI